MKQEIKKYLESETTKNYQQVEYNKILLRIVKLLLFIGLAIILGAVISLFYI